MSYNDPVQTLFSLIDDAFNTRSGSQLQRFGENQAPSVTRPRLDVHDDEKNNVVTATFELPGLKKEDVNIDLQNNLLTISGESKLSTERNEKGYVVRERRYGKFARSLQLPQGIKPEEIKATMENGVLTVTFPRTSPEQAPKKITIA